MATLPNRPNFIQSWDFFLFYGNVLTFPSFPNGDGDGGDNGNNNNGNDSDSVDNDDDNGDKVESFVFIGLGTFPDCEPAVKIDKALFLAAAIEVPLLGSSQLFRCLNMISFSSQGDQERANQSQHQNRTT